MGKHHSKTLVIGGVCLLIGFAIGIFVGRARGIPFVMQGRDWSIGIYHGDSPFNFKAFKNRINPVLIAEDVTDVPAKFVADPFLVEHNSTWHLFFEVYNKKSKHGDIAVATSNDATKWKYKHIVIDEPFHLSYPYVFKWQNNYFLIPESHETNSVRLYKAVDFPSQWTFLGTLIEGRDFVDPSIVYFKNKWWIFVSELSNDILRLYYANDLLGPWKEHLQSPIVIGDKNIARPGGRVLIYEDRLFRYTQDGDPTYGNQIWAFEITELTAEIYKEEKVKEDPILKADGSGWNAKAMHHIDPHQIGKNKWIASVDGKGIYRVFGFKY
jgi:hypothetical protein